MSQNLPAVITKIDPIKAFGLFAIAGLVLGTILLRRRG